MKYPCAAIRQTTNEAKMKKSHAGSSAFGILTARKMVTTGTEEPVEFIGTSAPT